MKLYLYNIYKKQLYFYEEIQVVNISVFENSVYIWTGSQTSGTLIQNYSFPFVSIKPYSKYQIKKINSFFIKTFYPKEN